MPIAGSDAGDGALAILTHAAATDVDDEPDSPLPRRRRGGSATAPSAAGINAPDGEEANSGAWGQ
eukprot:358462-Chlamydomonas_euryale.AAC.4